MKNTKIKCKSIEEAKAVLQLIEDRHPEVGWGAGGKPTEFLPWRSRPSENTVWFNIENDRIFYSFNGDLYPERWVNATSAKRFLRKAATSIHIYQRGKMVIAHESETGREGIAKCSPDDKFDFSIGARIALLRLFGEEVPDSLTGKEKIEEKEEFKVGENHKPTRFRVGELVTLKDGVDRGDVPGGITILNKMFKMGHRKPMEVEDIDLTDYGAVYTCKSEYGPYHFAYHEDALDKWEDIKVGDTVEIVNSGECYTSYTGWVAKNIVHRETIAQYAYGFTPREGTRGRVLQIADHGNRNDGLLVYINDDNNGKCYLIGIKGVKKVES